MAAITSNGTGGGLWSSTASWTGAVVPTEGDTVQILNGDTISADNVIMVGDDTSTPAIDVLDGGTIDWDNAGNDSLTLKGNFYVRGGGTLDFDGRTNNYTLDVYLNYSASPSVGKYRMCFETYSTFTVNGYDKTRPYDRLSVNADSTDATLTTVNDNSSNWNTGDEVVITKTDTYQTGNGHNEKEVIDSFSGEEVTLVDAISYDHTSNYGFIANLSRSITFSCYDDDTAYSTNIQITGCEVEHTWCRFHILGNGGSGYALSFSNDNAKKTIYNYKYCVLDYIGGYHLHSYTSGDAEWAYNIIYAQGGWLFNKQTTDETQVHHNMLLSTGLCGGGGTNINMHDNYYFGCSGTYNMYGWGVVTNMEYYDNLMVGCRGGIGSSLVFGSRIHDNTMLGIDDNVLYLAGGVGVLFQDNVLGSATLPCEDCPLFITSGFMVDMTVANTTGFWTTDPDIRNANLTTGSIVGVQNFGSKGNDFSAFPEGTLYRTGSGLIDTTSHTAGGSAVRFNQAGSDKMTWTFKVPTGDIANKTMNIGLWVKINSADYYSGTHELPRLTLDYDNGTEVYQDATETTDWQYINITFTPITTFGQVVASVSVLTDQTDSSAYVYLDDVSVLYPAGVILNLGNMDNWAGGLPIMPPISTLFSAADIWNVGVNTLTADGTLGNRLAASKITG